MGIDDTVGNGKELDSPYGNGNGLYSHGNKFPPADAVFSLCNSNVQFIMTFIIYYDSYAFDDNCLMGTDRFSDKLSTIIV